MALMCLFSDNRFVCKIKVKKPLQKPCIDQIENVTVKKTFAGTDQTT